MVFHKNGNKHNLKQLMPNSTNSLESFFGHLKVNLNSNIGLVSKTERTFWNGICITKSNQKIGFL